MRWTVSFFWRGRWWGKVASGLAWGRSAVDESEEYFNWERTISGDKMTVSGWVVEGKSSSI